MSKAKQQRDGITCRGGTYGYRFTYRENGHRLTAAKQDPRWSRADAVRERNAARAEIDAGRGGRAVTVTTAAYLATWLDLYERAGRRKSSTIESARMIVEKYLTPRIGGVLLRDLRRTTIERLYADLLETGRIHGDGGLSPKTIRNIAGVLHKALSDAVRRGQLAANPADDIDLPRWERPDLEVWDTKQVGQFLSHCATTKDPLLAVWRLILATGMRRGEVCGLRWNDVDLVDGTVTISQTRVKAGSTFIMATPKTRAGRRTVAIDAGTVIELAHFRNTLDAAAERYGCAPFAMVATNLDGNPIHPLTLTRRFQRTALAAGLPVPRLHDARHTAATQQLSASVPLHIVAGRLGHANAATTLAIYAAYLPTADRDAAMTVGTGLDDAILAHRLRTGESLRTVCAPDERHLTPLDDMSDVMKLNEIAHNDTNNSHALEATPGIEPGYGALQAHA